MSDVVRNFAYPWNDKCRTLVCVPGTHNLPLSEPQNQNSINWDLLASNKDLTEDQKEHIARDAVLIDPRPRKKQDCNATVVLWNSRTLHCSGSFQPPSRNAKKTAKTTRYLEKGVCHEGHFHVDNVKEWLEYANEHGFVVLELKMTVEEYNKMIKLFCISVQLVNKTVIDTEHPDCPRLEKIKAEHLPPFKAKGLQQFYGFCNTPFCDAMRLYPEMRFIFGKIYGVEMDEMYCSIDAGAFCMVKGDQKNWLHRDQTKNPQFPGKDENPSWQGCLYLKPPTPKFWRFAQMVAWHPVKQYSENEYCAMVLFMRRNRERGACLTHNNHKVNKEGNKLVGMLNFPRTKEKLEARFKVFTIPGEKKGIPFNYLVGSYKTTAFPHGIPIDSIQAIGTSGEEKQVADFLNRAQCFGHEGMKYVRIKTW